MACGERKNGSKENNLSKFMTVTLSGEYQTEHAADYNVGIIAVPLKRFKTAKEQLQSLRKTELISPVRSTRGTKTKLCAMIKSTEDDYEIVAHGVGEETELVMISYNDIASMNNRTGHPSYSIEAMADRFRYLAPNAQIIVTIKENDVAVLHEVISQCVAAGVSFLELYGKCWEDGSHAIVSDLICAANKHSGENLQLIKPNIRSISEMQEALEKYNVAYVSGWTPLENLIGEAKTDMPTEEDPPHSDRILRWIFTDAEGRNLPKKSGTFICTCAEGKTEQKKTVRMLEYDAGCSIWRVPGYPESSVNNVTGWAEIEPL